MMTESDSSKQRFLQGARTRELSQKNTGEQLSRREVYLCHFIEVGIKPSRNMFLTRVCV